LVLLRPAGGDGGARLAKRLTGALLYRLTCHVSILIMNGDSCRLRQSAASWGPGSNGTENIGKPWL
jgi:hypothetical protein